MEAQEYLLMHKNIPVISLTIDEEEAEIISTGKVFSFERLPFGISPLAKDNQSLITSYIQEWWKRRAIPESRYGLRIGLYRLNIKSAEVLLLKTLGLSLSDHYWVKPLNNQVDWKKINFFENDFSEDVGLTLCCGEVEDRKLDLFSPDSSTDGVLIKKWVISHGVRKLIKMGSAPSRQEPFNEAIASEIMRRLHIDHVHYHVDFENDIHYSVCDDVVTTQTELVSASNIVRLAGSPRYDDFIDQCQYLGIPGIQDFLNNMLVIDFIIGNKDRHWNNFGILRDADTLSWLGMAPIFDNGLSLWANIHPSNIDINSDIEAKPFQPFHSEQIKLVSNFDFLKLEDLNGIENDCYSILSKNINMPEESRDIISQGLLVRIRKLDEIANNFKASKQRIKERLGK
jgi:hypothetical protein